jgi:hypothetical protein
MFVLLSFLVPLKIKDQNEMYVTKIIENNYDDNEFNKNERMIWN